MTQIKITWKAFNEVARPGMEKSASATFVESFDSTATHDAILNAIYTATNLKCELEEFGYSKAYVQLWNVISTFAPANRTHTSLSIGDEIELDGIAYEVATIGFKQKVGA